MEKIKLTDSLELVSVQASNWQELRQLMDFIYKDAYLEYWEDGGNWYVDLIYNEANILKELGRNRSHYFFVIHLGEKVGILKYDFPFSPREIEIPNAMKLHRLYLAAKAQGQGIAAHLMRHIEDVARLEKLDWIWLEAMDCKPQAMRFYLKNGFKHTYSYILPFDLLKQEYRQIHILKKEINPI